MHFNHFDEVDIMLSLNLSSDEVNFGTFSKEALRWLFLAKYDAFQHIPCALLKCPTSSGTVRGSCQMEQLSTKYHI